MLHKNFRKVNKVGHGWKTLGNTALNRINFNVFRAKHEQHNLSQNNTFYKYDRSVKIKFLTNVNIDFTKIDKLLCY